MSHVSCALHTLGIQNIFQIVVGAWPGSREKSRAHGKISENRIAFEILNTVRLPWWGDAKVNSCGLLWQFRAFRLRVVSLSIYSPLCVTSKKTSRKKISPKHFYTHGHSQRTTLCEAKWICGTTSPRVTVHALSYESVKVHLTPKFFFGRDETVQLSHKEFANFISMWYF